MKARNLALQAAIVKTNNKLVLDAARYRFLRAQQVPVDDGTFNVIKSAQWRGAGDCDPEFFETPEELDAAIDAMLEEKTR